MQRCFLLVLETIPERTLIIYPSSISLGKEGNSGEEREKTEVRERGERQLLL